MGGIPFELAGHDDTADPVSLGGVRPRRRSLWALAALAAGYTLARDILPVAPASIFTLHATWWFGVCQALLALALMTRGRCCRVVLFVAAVFFGLGWFTARFHNAPADRLDRLLMADSVVSGSPNVATITGVVLEPPRRALPRMGELGRFARTPTNWVFDLSVRSLEADRSVAAQGIVRVSIRSGSAAVPSVAAGEWVRLTGDFRPIAPPLSPGEPDRRMLALQDGIVGRIGIPNVDLVQPLERHAGVTGVWSRFIAAARARAVHALEVPGDPPAATDGHGRTLLAAMLLGLREEGIDEVGAAFQRVGLVHLVAISGFNLAVLAVAAGYLFRILGDRGRFESLGVALIIALYLLVVPAESPILRAGITVLAFLLTESLGRRYDRLTLLGWVAVGLLIWRPLDLWSLGFQLSFGIVAVLLWLGKRVEARMFGVPLRGVVSVGIPIGERRSLVMQWAVRVGKFLARVTRKAFSASLLAWLVAAPVIMVHTGMLSPWAALTGLAALPLTVITLCSGYLALLVGVAWPAAGALLAEHAVAWADLTASLVFLLDDFPAASLAAPRISVWWAAAAVACTIYLLAYARRRQLLPWILTLALTCWFVIEVRAVTRLNTAVALRVDTFAVGDGTCHLIRRGRDAMLWDCGSSNTALGLRDLPRALRTLGAHRVPDVLITHANLDHFLCLPDVLRPLGVERVHLTHAFLEDASRPDSAAAAFIQILEHHRVAIVECHAGDSLLLSDLRCELLAPEPGITFKESNDTSLVGLFRVPTQLGERSALFTGDIGPVAITRVRDLAPALEVDIAEIPHHGSAKPEAMAFIAAINPAIALQSTGPQRLGDPRWDHVKHGRVWRTTAADGACWAEIMHDGRIRSGSLRSRGVETVNRPSP